MTPLDWVVGMAAVAALVMLPPKYRKWREARRRKKNQSDLLS